MSSLDIRYKEYKAYVPPKWSAFEEANMTRNDCKFTAFLRGPNKDKALTDLIPADSSDSEDSSDGVKLKKKKKNWTESMLKYTKHQQLKELAKTRTAQLERDIEKKRKAALAVQERKAEALTLDDGSPLPSSFSVLQSRYPDLAQQQYFLVCSALEASGSHNAQVVEERYQERQRKRKEALDAKEKAMSAVTKKVASQRRDNREELHEVMTEAQMRAAENRQNLDKSRHKWMKNIEEKRTEADNHLHWFLEQRSASCLEKQIQSSAMIDEKVSKARQEAEKNEAEFAELMQEKLERATKQVVMMQTSRDARRAARLERAKKKEKERKAQIARIREEVVRKVESDPAVSGPPPPLSEDDPRSAEYWIERNRAREESARAALEHEWKSRADKINRSLSSFHSRGQTPSVMRDVSAIDTSQTAESVAQHLHRYEKQQAEKAHQAFLMDAAAHEHERQLLQKAAVIQSERDARAKMKEMHRLNVIAHAAELHDEQERLIAEEGEMRERTWTKRIQEHNARRQQETEEAEAEQAQRIAAALELVNVKKRQQAEEALKEKERRVEEAMRRKAIEREALNARRQAELEEAQRKRDAAVSEAAARKARAFAERLEQKKIMATRARAQRDEKVDSQCRHLAEKGERELKKARDAIDNKETTFLLKKEELMRRDQIKQNELRAFREKQEEERLEKQMEKEEKMARFRQNCDEQREEFRAKTVGTLLDVYDPRRERNTSPHGFSPPPGPVIRKRAASSMS